jgi:hypothetical protein
VFAEKTLAGKGGEKLKGLRHWLWSSRQLLRGSQTTWTHVPSQPSMRSLLSQFQTPTEPRRTVGFFGSGRSCGSPHLSGSLSLHRTGQLCFDQPFRPSTVAILSQNTKMSTPNIGAIARKNPRHTLRKNAPVYSHLKRPLSRASDFCRGFSTVDGCKAAFGAGIERAS